LRFTLNSSIFTGVWAGRIPALPGILHQGFFLFEGQGAGDKYDVAFGADEPGSDAGVEDVVAVFYGAVLLLLKERAASHDVEAFLQLFVGSFDGQKNSVPWSMASRCLVR
jgi:hypothetical protein